MMCLLLRGIRRQHFIVEDVQDWYVRCTKLYLFCLTASAFAMAFATFYLLLAITLIASLAIVSRLGVALLGSRNFKSRSLAKQKAMSERWVDLGVTILGPSYTHANRPIRLNCKNNNIFDNLVVQYVEGLEQVNGEYRYTVRCVSTEAGLPSKGWIGEPLEIQMCCVCFDVGMVLNNLGYQ